jgi:epoxyqueuosine reductase QueG
MVDQDRKSFETDPARFLERAIQRYVADSPDNHLKALDGQTIFDQPLVGFADGSDPIFREYKQLIGDFHLTPGEVLALHLEKKSGGARKLDGPLSVISWVMPIHRPTLLGMREETRVPSLKWNHTRWNGQALIDQLAQYLVSLLQGLGHEAAAPDRTEWFKMVDLENGLASSWSQRHMAYAAGLGTFSLSDGFITRRGIALRCGSVVADIALPPSPRTYPGPHANCLHYQGKTCMRCAKRCPADAITEKGHDKKKCLQYLFVGQRAALAELGRDQGYIGDYLGCGLCQTGVPCEQRIPTSAD